MTELVFIFWVYGTHIGLIPVQQSPAFPDKVSCEEALKSADPFLPGKTACWPKPWRELGEKQLLPSAPPPRDERLD